METKVFELSSPSEISNIKSVMISILLFIEKNVAPLSDEIRCDLKLIFQELLGNAVKHGNNQNNSKNVYVYIEASCGVIKAAIADEGIGFDYIKIFSSFEEDDVMKEHGRGIRLVNSLADDLSFNKKGNEINFSKKVTTNG